MGIRDRKRSKSLGMFILNIVLVFAMIVNGTYAWRSLGQTINGGFISLSDAYEVTLLKQEKDNEGNIIPDSPLEGVEFTVFRVNSDNTEDQIGSPYRTDDNGEITATVGSGNFYFIETDFIPGYGMDLDEDDNPIEKYFFTVLPDGTVVPGVYDPSEEVDGIISNEVDIQSVMDIEIQDQNHNEDDMVGDELKNSDEDEDESEGSDEDEDESEGSDENESEDELESSNEDEGDNESESSDDNNIFKVDVSQEEQIKSEIETIDENHIENESEFISHDIIVYNRPYEILLEIEKEVVNKDGSAIESEQLTQLFEFIVDFGDDPKEYTYYVVDEEGNPIVKEETEEVEEETEEVEEETEEIEEETEEVEEEIEEVEEETEEVEEETEEVEEETEEVEEETEEVEEETEEVEEEVEQTEEPHIEDENLDMDSHENQQDSVTEVENGTGSEVIQQIGPSPQSEQEKQESIEAIEEDTELESEEIEPVLQSIELEVSELVSEGNLEAGNNRTILLEENNQENTVSNQEEQVVSDLSNVITESPELSEIEQEAISFIANLSELLIFDYSDNGDNEVSYEGSIQGNGKIYLTHGQKVIFNNVSTETHYEVSETSQPHYTVTTEGESSGNVSYGGSYVKFINEFNNVDEDDYASMYLSKTVVGEEADKEKKFKFYLQVNGETPLEFELSHNEDPILIDEIPVGATYTIWEDVDGLEHYYPEVSSFTNTVLNTEDIFIEFVNHYLPDIDQDSTGDLVIRKEIAKLNDGSNDELDIDKDIESDIDEDIESDIDKDIESDIDEDIEFEFGYSYDDPENPGEVIEDTFVLSHDGIYVLEEIPFGTIVTIEEIDPKGYTPEINKVEITILGKSYDEKIPLEEQDAQVYTFVNNEVAEDEKVTLTITKIVTGITTEDEFEFNLRINEVEQVPILLKDGESEIIELVIGSTYMVSETPYEDYRQSSIGKNTGTITEDTSIVFTNAYKYEKVTIKGTKSWASIPSEDIQSQVNDKEVTIKLMRELADGTLIYVDDYVTSKKQDDPWTYIFQVNKNDVYGFPYRYVIEEIPVDNFVATYSYDEDTDSYDVCNTYVAEVEYNIPLVEKQIKGINTTNTQFTFAMSSQNGAPMPSSVGIERSVRVLYGAGETDFSSITYTKPGWYEYTIYEVNEGLEDWVYDETEYKLEVNVYINEANGYELMAEGFLTNGESLVSKAIFVNEYVGEDSDDGAGEDSDGGTGEDSDDGTGEDSDGGTGEDSDDGAGEDSDGGTGEDSDDGAGDGTQDEDGLGATHKYVEGTKTWEHGLNSSEHQPSKLVVYILGDGEVYQAIETSASKNWSYKFGVPKRNENGEEIKYTIGEEPVDGYNGVAIGYDLYNTFDLSSLVEPDSPQTSDYSQIWIWVWGLIASSITFVYVNRRKRVLRHGRRW